MDHIFNNYITKYTLDNVFIMKHSPKILRKKIEGRPTNSFLYVLSGRCHYKYGDTEFWVEESDTAYLPKGSCYFYEVVSKETQCIQLEFDLEEVNGTEIQNVVLSEKPMLVYGYKNELKNLFEELLSAYYDDKIKALSLIFNLLNICNSSLMNDKKPNKDFVKIAPAMRYIEENFQNKIYVEDLAKMVCVSQSHLRRLFQKCLGMSPVKYKNSILMKAACNMLLNDSMNVSETANALQFNDIYTFSQLFKKEIGISPKRYIEEHTKNSC